MTPAMYLTIWAALALFAGGELGRARLGRVRAARSWPWWCWILGIALCAAHFVIALDVRHDWSHAAAIQATARQTAAVYGVDWGGGFYANYLFLGVWAVDAWRWRQSPRAARPPLLSLVLRAFYFVIILNAAVIFAAGWRRAIGAVIIGVLVIAWMSNRELPP